jgi:hypothetical protein
MVASLIHLQSGRGRKVVRGQGSQVGCGGGHNNDVVFGKKNSLMKEDVFDGALS